MRRGKFGLKWSVSPAEEAGARDSRDGAGRQCTAPQDKQMIEVPGMVLLSRDFTWEDNTGSGGRVCGSDDTSGVTAIDLACH